MEEIRLHGRGGQGAAMAAEILAAAYVREGKYASSFPVFGAERRGAPVTSFTRFSEEPVRERCKIYHPGYVIVFDATLKDAPFTVEGLSADGFLLVNSSDDLKPDILDKAAVVAMVDGTRIALEAIGNPITNTCLLGAFAAASGTLKLASILDALSDYFSGTILEKNRRAVERGYAEVKVVKGNT